MCYIDLDIHKGMISHCVKDVTGRDNYASPPSSPGSRVQACHISSSAWTAQNHRPQIPQWKVAAESQGSSKGETA
jgi:hypothetical protein